MEGKKRTRFGFDVGIRPERFFLEIFSRCSSRYMGFSCFVRCYIGIIYFFEGEEGGGGLNGIKLSTLEGEKGCRLHSASIDTGMKV